MSNELAKSDPSPLFAWLGETCGIEAGKALAVVKATCFANPAQASAEHVAAFLMTCRRYNLDPITRQVHAFVGRNGSVQPIIGIDGWLQLANSHPAFDGCEYNDTLEQGVVIACTCRIHRKDRGHPTEVTEYLKECQRATDPWRQWPARMLRHKAFIQCARQAFSFAGVLDPDEAERYREAEQPKNAREACLSALPQTPGQVGWTPAQVGGWLERTRQALDALPQEDAAAELPSVATPAAVDSESAGRTPPPAVLPVAPPQALNSAKVEALRKLADGIGALAKERLMERVNQAVKLLTPDEVTAARERSNTVDGCLEDYGVVRIRGFLKELEHGRGGCDE